MVTGTAKTTTVTINYHRRQIEALPLVEVRLVVVHVDTIIVQSLC